MLDLRLLLEEMTVRFPPGVKQAHAISLAPTVPGALRLTLLQDKVMLDLILGTEDMQKTVTEVRDEILTILIAEGYTPEAVTA